MTGGTGPWIAICRGAAARRMPAGVGSAWAMSAGPDAAPDRDLASDSLLPDGAVMIEFRQPAAERPENILRYRARDPVPAAFSLRRDPDGTLALLLRQGELSSMQTLLLPEVHPGDTIRVTYHWRTTGGETTGLFVASVPRRDVWMSVEMAQALPLARRDAQRLAVADLRMGAESQDASPTDAARARHRHQAAQAEFPEYCTAAPGLIFAAVCTGILPAGPLPGIHGHTQIATPHGPRLLADLRPGDLITATDGAPASILWSGAFTLPALGSFLPHILRTPYYGVTQDLILAGAQRLQMSGSEIEYLFFQEEVAVAIGDLADHRAVVPWGGDRIARYHQLALDRPALLNASGACLPPLDMAALGDDPALRAWSALAGLPPGSWPAPAPAPMPALRDFEAAALRSRRAA